MLDTKVSFPQPIHSPLGLPFYAFLIGDKDHVTMTPVNVHTTDALVIESENAEWVYPEQEIKRLLVDAFEQVPQVQAIYAQLGTDEITIWTLLDSYDREARSRVHERELEVSQTLHVYDFDFRVTSADVVPPEELQGSGMRKIFNRQITE